MRRKRIIIGLVVLNALLAGALAASSTTVFWHAAPGLDCCQSSGGSDFCCDGCCWFVQDCDSDGDC